jgi:hypothetical protein
MTAAGMAATLAAIAERDHITGDQAARNRIADGYERLAAAIRHRADVEDRIRARLLPQLTFTNRGTT